MTEVEIKEAVRTVGTCLLMVGHSERKVDEYPEILDSALAMLRLLREVWEHPEA